jgi:peptidoglycan/xylan/chitin deacetylase (PgdA/CDA1 family)
MRMAATFALLVLAAGTAQAQAPCSGNPNALGVARTVEIDTTGGPGFGSEHFPQHDFLRAKEVILTFDDGPWEKSTPIALKALAEHCVKATFFTIGKHATYYPGVLKQVLESGHSLGTHTWSHPRDIGKMSLEDGKAEIEKGISAVVMSAGAPITPFFRFPSLIHPPELVKYLGSRNIGIFSTDLDSFDFKNRKSESVIKAVLEKLKKKDKGIVLMHDFHLHTAQATAELLVQLKANGYKIVHMKAKGTLKSLPEFDELVKKDQKLPTVSDRPTSSVVRTVD